MKNTRFLNLRTLTLLATACTALGIHPAAAATIKHDPVRVAMPGQSIAVRATIVGEAPRSVSLFFTPSRDVAPFRLPMRASGEGVYAVTIQDLNLAGLREVYYYIETRDLADNASETPWYTVTIQNPSTDTAATTPATVVKSAATPVKPAGSEEESNWVKPTLIGVGILAAGGVAYALADSGGGGGGDGGGDDPPVSSAAGTYSGSQTTCGQPPGGATSCESGGFTLTIDEQGNVRSSDLRSGASLQTTLSGNNFVMVAPYDVNGVTGELQYIGTVVDQRVVGSIQGSASGVAGVTTFSGTFSGVKR